MFFGGKIKGENERGEYNQGPKTAIKKRSKGQWGPTSFSVSPSPSPSPSFSLSSYLDSDVALRDFSHIETDSWDHIFGKFARGNNVDKCCLARVLQADKSQLHLLLPKQALEPFYFKYIYI